MRPEYGALQRDPARCEVQCPVCRKPYVTPVSAAAGAGYSYVEADCPRRDCRTRLVVVFFTPADADAASRFHGLAELGGRGLLAALLHAGVPEVDAALIQARIARAREREAPCPR